MTEAGIKGLLVTFDSFDAVVVNELKGVIQDILDNPWEGHHDYKESLKDVDGFFRVLSWYMRSSEYKEYFEDLKPLYDDLVGKAFPKEPIGDLDITITTIRELPDGGANVEYEVNDKMKDFIMGVGLLKILTDHIGRMEDEIQEEVAKKSPQGEVPGWEYYQGDLS